MVAFIAFCKISKFHKTRLVLREIIGKEARKLLGINSCEYKNVEENLVNKNIYIHNLITYYV